MNEIINRLLQAGRGFDFQYHGDKGGNHFYNFALYSPKEVPVSQRKTLYFHQYELPILVKQVNEALGDFDTVDHDLDDL
jgi:hypothetical protein